MAREWEALELTFKALTEFESVLDPLPDRLTKTLLPKFGVRLVHVEFRPSQVYPPPNAPDAPKRCKQRVCDVKYALVRQQQQHDDYRTGTLESVVWNAALFSCSPVVPRDVRLCSVETMQQFLEYVYVAMGYSHHAPSTTKHMYYIHPCVLNARAETLHRSWVEFNFGRWDTSGDMLTRYVKLRALVPFPSSNEFPNPVVTLRTDGLDVVGVPFEVKASDVVTQVERSLMVKAYQDAYDNIMRESKERYERGEWPTLTWGLGALAFFGTCGGGTVGWHKAIDEARLWFSTTADSVLDIKSTATERIAARLVSGTADTFHFPEAMFALTRVVFCGNVQALHGARKLAAAAIGSDDATTIDRVTVTFADGNAADVEAAKKKPYVANIGHPDKFGDALANCFWIDLDTDDVDKASKPAVERVQFVLLQHKGNTLQHTTHTKADLSLAASRPKVDVRADDSQTFRRYLGWFHFFDSVQVPNDIAERAVYDILRDFKIRHWWRFTQNVQNVEESVRAHVNKYVALPFTDIPRDPTAWISIYWKYAERNRLASLEFTRDDKQRALWLVTNQQGDHFSRTPFSKEATDAFQELRRGENAVHACSIAVHALFSTLLASMVKLCRIGAFEKDVHIQNWQSRKALYLHKWVDGDFGKLVRIPLASLMDNCHAGFLSNVREIVTAGLRADGILSTQPASPSDVTTCVKLIRTLAYDVYDGMVVPVDAVAASVLGGGQRRQRRRQRRVNNMKEPPPPKAAVLLRTTVPPEREAITRAITEKLNRSDENVMMTRTKKQFETLTAAYDTARKAYDAAKEAADKAKKEVDALVAKLKEEKTAAAVSP